MNISASMVKELRDKTGAGMMDCKKALEANDGDAEKALDWLRLKGLSKAAKRADRSTNEGIIGCKAAADGKSAVMVEVKCETDFVSRGDKFRELAAAVTNHVAENFTEDHDALMASAFNGTTLEKAVGEAVAAIGENIIIGKTYKLAAENGIVGTYVHFTNKLGAMVSLEASAPEVAAKPEVAGLATQIAMHVVASNPISLDPDSLDPALKERERNVYIEKARAEGKPEKIIEKIADGAVQKYYKDVCLVEQPWVLDEKQSVKDVLKQAGKEAGGELKLTGFVRVQL